MPQRVDPRLCERYRKDVEKKKRSDRKTQRENNLAPRGGAEVTRSRRSPCYENSGGLLQILRKNAVMFLTMPGQQHCREKTHKKRRSQKREKLGLMADEGTETKRCGGKNNRTENREQYTERRGNQHDGTMSNWTHTFFLRRVATNASCIQKLGRNNSDDVHQARD